MGELAIRQGNQPVPAGVWDWWQARRLRYNLALAAAGATAYLIAIGVHYAFGDAIWLNWREALGQTLLLGTLYLGVIGIANVCYLLGPLGEAWLRPADSEHFRKTAFAMGFWGSLALPFLFPLANLSLLIGNGAG